MPVPKVLKPMNRRVDQRTAELVDIALLTRAAFEQDVAHRYAGIAGVPDMLAQEVFARPPHKVRKPTLGSYAGATDDRRRSPRI